VGEELGELTLEVSVGRAFCKPHEGGGSNAISVSGLRGGGGGDTKGNCLSVCALACYAVGEIFFLILVFKKF
jgi:hypothetical protein